jgi:hypothetical protein
MRVGGVDPSPGHGLPGWRRSEMRVPAAVDGDVGDKNGRTS